MNYIYAQNKYITYSEIFNEAELKYIDKSYKEGIKLFKEAAKIVHHPINYKKIAEGYAAISRNKKTYKYLYKYLKTGGSFQKIKKAKLFKSFRSTSFWEKLVIDKDKLFDEYISTLDISYLNELVRLEAVDQHVREMYRNEFDTEKKYLNASDSINFKKLILLIESKDIPMLESVGNEGMNIFWILLWHHRYTFSETEQWQKVIRIIEKAIQEEKIRPSFLAWLEDHYLLYVKKTGQKYGTEQDWSDPMNLKLMPIQDIKDIDKRRLAIGLCTLKDLNKKTNIKLPDEYKDQD